MALSTAAAMASDLVTTDVVMVNLFPYLAIRYGAEDVPTTVVDGKKRLVGPVAEAAFVEAITGG